MLKLNLAIYQKLFLSAITIFISSVVGMFLLISYSYVQVQIENETDLNEKKLTEIMENVRYDLLSINNTIHSLYENPQTLTDTLNYLALSPEQYYNFRLSFVATEANFYYQGHETFVQNIFSQNQRVVGVGLYSYDQDKLTTFKPFGSSVKINQVSKQKLNNTLDASIKQRFDLEYEYAIPITYSLKRGNDTIGEVVIFHNLGFIDDIIDRYNQSTRRLTIQYNQKMIYDSLKQQEYLEPVQADYLELGTAYNLRASNKDFIIHEDSVNTNFFNYAGRELFVVGIFVAASVLLGCYFIWRRMREAETRLESVLKGISRFESGDLDAVIEIDGENKDEITIIANRLNNMNKEIKQRIQDQYLSEINQQKAELAFLQSQINPHFLYNTLETIRMKAIIEGNREVGQLIFGLATLFRQTYQKSRIITINEEIELIETYLKLFINRYPDVFVYTIECEEQLKGEHIVKFILQPIIENYFVHGIDYEESNNQLFIQINSISEKIQITLSDNGSGMSSQEIDELNDKLKNAKIYELEKSIALVNINKRLELTYGDSYSFKFYKNQMNGLSIEVIIPKLQA